MNNNKIKNYIVGTQTQYLIWLIVHFFLVG